MIECKGCRRLFATKQNTKFCSRHCQQTNWRKNNANYAAKQKEWLVNNPHKRAEYNARRRKKYHDNIDEARAKQRASQGKYREKHRAKQREYYQKYYRRNAIKQHQEKPWKSLLAGAKRRAKLAGIRFSLTENWAKKRWTGACELTGIAFAPAETRVGYKRRNFNPSIDRIKSAGPYTPANCRIVLWAINSFKRDGTDKEMYMIARALIKQAPIRYLENQAPQE